MLYDDLDINLDELQDYSLEQRREKPGLTTEEEENIDYHKSLVDFNRASINKLVELVKNCL
jgi:DNA-directed RNA polymerase subunit F